jgi:hypothetical protein
MLKFSLTLPPVRNPDRHGRVIATSVSYETLAWSRSRQEYQNALRAADLLDNPNLVIKVDDVPNGTPASRIADIVSALRPLVKRVFVQLSDRDSSLMRGGCVGSSGLCAALSPKMTMQEVAQSACWLRRTATAQNALSCVIGAEGAGALRLLRDAGIRFASQRPGNDDIRFGGLPPDSALSSRRCAA